MYKVEDNKKTNLILISNSPFSLADNTEQQLWQFFLNSLLTQMNRIQLFWWKLIAIKTNCMHVIVYKTSIVDFTTWM